MAAAGVVVLLRKRWIRMELMMGVESDRHGPATGRRGRYARRKIGSYEVEEELDETLGPLGVPFWGVLSVMDQDGSGGGGLSGRAYPAGWATKTRAQMHRYNQRRRK